MLVKSGEGGTNEQIVLEEMTQEIVRLGTCQKLAGGKGVETEGGSQLFETAEKVGGGGHEKWAVKRGRVMQLYVRDHVEVHPQKKKEVIYFVKKTWEK